MSSLNLTYVSATPGSVRPPVVSRPATATTQKCEYRVKCERFVKSLNIAGNLRKLQHLVIQKNFFQSPVRPNRFNLRTIV